MYDWVSEKPGLNVQGANTRKMKEWRVEWRGEERTASVEWMQRCGTVQGRKRYLSVVVRDGYSEWGVGRTKKAERGRRGRPGEERRQTRTKSKHSKVQRCETIMSGGEEKCRGGKAVRRVGKLFNIIRTCNLASPRAWSRKKNRLVRRLQPHSQPVYALSSFKFKFKTFLVIRFGIWVLNMIIHLLWYL